MTLFFLRKVSWVMKLIYNPKDSSESSVRFQKRRRELKLEASFNNVQDTDS